MVCALSAAPNHPDMQVTKLRGLTCKERKTYVTTGLSPYGDFATYNNTIDAAECAVKERVFYILEDGQFVPPPRPLVGYYTTLLEKQYAILKRHATFCNPWSTIDFALSYGAPKRDMYLRAANDLTIKPFSNRDSYVKAFLKFEKYNFKPNKRVVPRVISPRGPRFTVEMGRYIRPIEKKIYAIINNEMFGQPTILKGMNPYDRGKVIQAHFDSFEKPCAIGIDASRFDQHVSKEALTWEHSIYQLFYPGSKHFRRLCRLQTRNKIFINMEDGSIKYSIDGTRMSGDVNTSLGNCLISCSLVHRYAEELGITVKLVNDGDDCVVFMAGKDEAVFREHLPVFFRKAGFNMVVEPTVYELEHVEFCQAKPVFDGHDYIMVRNPHTCIAKDSVSLRPLLNPLLVKRWWAAVGLCGLSGNAGFPILDSFYRCLIRNSQGAKPLMNHDDGSWKYKYMDYRRDTVGISDYSRHSFYIAFGIDATHQCAIEEYYDNLLLLPQLCVDMARHVDLPFF